MCCTNDLDEVFVGRPNTGNQHKTFPVAKREKRENQFPIPLGLGFAKLANHVRFVAWPAERPMEPVDVEPVATHSRR